MARPEVEDSARRIRDTATRRILIAVVLLPLSPIPPFHAQPTAQPSTLNAQPASTNYVLWLGGTNGLLGYLELLPYDLSTRTEMSRMREERSTNTEIP